MAVFQDYLFSKLKNTGFYISESLLYNVLWVLTIPFIFLELALLKRLRFKNQIARFILVLGVGSLLSLVQIALSTLCFITVSHIVFSPPHRFVAMFNSYLSNQLFILVLIYTTVPFIKNALNSFQEKTMEPSIDYPSKIKVTSGGKIILIETDKIHNISTAKPYSVITVDDNTYIDERSLKSFEALLNPIIFSRVHRSGLINLKHVIEMYSRQNGDYDALLSNGRIVRLSRHYRKNWESLLQ